MNESDLRRRFFAEELEAVCRLRSPALVEAFAQVRRDDFLPAGPWTVLSDGARLRRDTHEPAASCWLHAPLCCFSAM
jgi:hypothetical protein